MTIQRASGDRTLPVVTSMPRRGSSPTGKGETDARAASACGRGDLCFGVTALVRLRCDRQDGEEDEKLQGAQPS